MSTDVRDSERGKPMGRLLQLPLNTIAGDAAAARAELLARLRERRGAVVEEMAETVHRAGLATVMSVGGMSLLERMEVAVGIVFAYWEHHRRLTAAELDALAALGGEVARAGIPLWRLLTAVQQAARGGWQYALEQALSLPEGGRRPGTIAQLVGDLSLELYEVVGRMEAQLAAGYGETRRPASLAGQRASSPALRR